MRRCFLISFLMLVCFCSPSLFAADPSDTFVQALLASQAGEKLASEGKSREALLKFNAAAQLLDQLRAESPKWQPLVREYRARKTAEFISELQALQPLGTQGIEPELPIDDTLIPGAERSLPTPDFLDDFPPATQSGPAGSAEAAELRRQITEARLEIKRLRQQNNEITQKHEFASANLRDALKRVDQSRVAVAELRSQLAQTEDNLRSATNARKQDTSDITLLRENLAVLQQQLAERTADATLVEDEANELTQNLTQANTRVIEATQNRDAALLEREAAEAQKKLALEERDTALLARQTLQTEFEKLQFDQAAAEKAITANAELATKLEAAEKQIAELSVRPQAEELAILQTQLADIQTQLTASENQAKSFATNIDELKAQLETSSQALTDARAQSATSEETIQLQSENELLRSVVLRTIKEQIRRNQSREIVSEELARIEGKSQTLLDQIDVLGAATLQLTDAERKLFKEPELAALDASNPGLSVEMVQPDGLPVTESLPSSDVEASASASPEITPSPGAVVPEKYASLVARAKTFFEQGKLGDAERAYKEILTDDPNNLYALSNLGVVHYKTGKMPQAEKMLVKAVAIAPRDFFANCTLGIVYYRLGKYEKAIEALTTAITIDPKSATAHNYLGIAASQKGWFEAAVSELEKAITLDPGYADAWFNLSVIYATSEPPRIDKARDTYRKSLELGAESDPAMERLFQ